MISLDEESWDIAVRSGTADVPVTNALRFPVSVPDIQGCPSVGGLRIVICGLGTSGRNNADVVRGVCLPPHEALLASVGSVWTAVGFQSTGGLSIVGGRLRADFTGDANVVSGIGFTPNPT